MENIFKSTNEYLSFIHKLGGICNSVSYEVYHVNDGNGYRLEPHSAMQEKEILSKLIESIKLQNLDYDAYTINVDIIKNAICFCCEKLTSVEFEDVSGSKPGDVYKISARWPYNNALEKILLSFDNFYWATNDAHDSEETLVFTDFGIGNISFFDFEGNAILSIETHEGSYKWNELYGINLDIFAKEID